MPGDERGGRGAPEQAAVAAALAVVPGVVDAWMAFDADGLPLDVRIELAPGAMAAEVAASAQSILQEQFGVRFDPAHVQVLELPDSDPLIPGPRLHVVDSRASHVIRLGGALPAARDAEHDRDRNEAPAATDRGASGAAPATAGAGREVVDLPRTPWRPVIEAVVVVTEGASTVARVLLRQGGVVHTGTAEGWSAPSSILRTVAEATANGLSAALGPRDRLEVEVVSLVPAGSLEVVVVQVARLTPSGSERLLGAAEVLDDVHRTVIRATLDAVNRRLAPAHGR